MQVSNSGRPVQCSALTAVLLCATLDSLALRITFDPSPVENQLPPEVLIAEAPGVSSELNQH